MKKPTSKKSSTKKSSMKKPSLRKRAVGMLAKQKERLRELSALELNKLVHELGTHQIELEMQNEELRRAQAEIESSRRKYADLYDFSPVGYFTFDRNGSIREVNHTGAGMLGLEKRSLIAGPFQNFIEPAGRAAFHSHLAEVFRTQTLQTCEVDLRGKNGILFAAQLQSIVANIEEGTIDTCRTALSDITKRKKAEQALRESEERLRLAHRAANIGAFEWNVQTGVNVWTPQLETMYGLDRGEFGKTQPAWEQLIHPEDRAAALGLVDQAFETGDPIEGEWRAVWRDGSVHWIAARFQAFKDAAGKPLRLSGVNMDITQRKQAEELLRQSEEQFRTLADSIPNLAWWANADGYITWYNRRWYEYTGTTPEQMEGWGWQSVHDPKVLPKVLERWKASIATGLPFDMEFPLRGADGVFRSFLTRVQPVKDSAGLVLRWFGTNTDISALKLAEEALRQSEERFRSYFELGLIGMAITSPAKGTIEVNEKICEILGYERSELLQLTWTELTHGDDLAADVALFNRVLAGEIDGYTIDKRFIRKNGEIVYATISVKCVRTADGSVDFFVALLQDITERKRAEEALKAVHAELERRAYELDAVNRELEAFAYTVSHDLKAPLRSIEGFTRAIVEDYSDKLDDPGKDYLRRVTAASQRMTQLIDAMLNMARLTRGELHEKTVDIGALAHVIAHDLQKQEPDRQVAFVIADKVTVSGDRTMLQVMLENLMHNAWKFTSNHKSARIEFGKTEMQGKMVYFVRDDGVGFDMQFADKLFRPFMRLHTETEFPGIGIGLAIVKRIITRHGGRIWAESAPENGATLYFTI